MNTTDTTALLAVAQYKLHPELYAVNAGHGGMSDADVARNAQKVAQQKLRFETLGPWEALAMYKQLAVSDIHEPTWVW